MLKFPGVAMGLVLLCCAPAGYASRLEKSNVSSFPEDMARDDSLMRIAGENPLWVANGLGPYVSRWRMEISGIKRDKLIIRLDEHSSGKVSGTYIRIYKSNRALRLREKRGFAISRPAFEALKSEAAQKGILNLPRQGWELSSDPETICMDGEDVLIERVDARGYYATGGNSWCSAPAYFLEFAARIIRLSGGFGLSLLVYAEDDR
ncbi:hypothetical protein [Novosphingobium colocasiae]|uniref:Uncharacterized protein n=1 Tax=Novosphingobium colocasiae TaxID=1256513 RepID=A0A918P9F0_9SPHN|nr:hypothetical protein [Novosphingobium colocasiae]GGY92403.1 hypothetical protein GCM10011614_03980 [Novosphingobium colocasiae]